MLPFADNSKLQSVICSPSDPLSLQSDIDPLVSWTHSNSLLINPRKCAVMRFFFNECSSPVYCVDGDQISVPLCHHDLGIIVCDLSWASHYDSICSKANSSLYLIHRTFSTSLKCAVKKQLYLSMVRSKLCYASQLWRRQLKKHILLLERVQRRASKYVLGDYTSSYRDRLIQLSLFPLLYWLKLLDIMYLVKSLKFPSDNMSILEFISFNDSATRSSASHKLKHNFCRTSRSHNSYFNRIVRLWNKLPKIDLTESLATIKTKLHVCIISLESFSREL
uniref:Reverse transcriptase domain-containing protein n=1 Tax=Amphimedon queenslandica TaxID=400682 RepID=A0A1X7TSZ9_AMPQE